MSNFDSKGVSRRRSLFIWGLFCAVAGGIFLVYTLTSLTVGRGEFVMPLDDAYIHFQYARQIAAGQPYVYNPGLPPSSGATSFLYPYLLAVGYLLGFQGLHLGLWAMGIGALALVGSMWLVYRLVSIYGAGDWLAVVIALAFGVSGPVAWHFMSGMETGLVMLFTLGTVYAVSQYLPKNQLNRHPTGSFRTDAKKDEIARSSFRQVVIWATLMALIRPEGAVLAILAVGAIAVTEGSKPSANVEDKPLKGVVRRNFENISYIVQDKSLRWIVVPILAIGVQPLVNWALTGSAVASGNAAKSIFGMIPFSWGAVIGRIVGNFAEMWTEFFTGISPREGMYIMPLLLVLALVGIGFLLVRRERRLVGLMIIGSLLGGTLLISTLDTAFWHFKRYQMPFIALLFPLAGWGLPWILGIMRIRTIVFLRNAVYGIAAILLLCALWTTGQFLRYYALNVDYVYLQPLQMARWLQANTPPDAVVAVHDTGMMRYMGGRTTIDIVGLTTPGAADYWRNGPGAVAEYLMDKHPDYIAAYGPGHGLGLGMIADTDIYGKPLASFPVVLDNNANVALAADFQGIYKPDWKQIYRGGWGFSLPQFSLGAQQFEGDDVPSNVNVGDIQAEKQADYRWWDNEDMQGFPTEVHEFGYFEPLPDFHFIDGGRNINGGEEFNIGSSDTPVPLLLITQVHPLYAGTLDIYINGQFVSTRVIPKMPGYWFGIPTYIPQEDWSNPLHVQIIAHVPDGFYAPYDHVIYGANKVDNTPPLTSLTTFQNGGIVLAKANIGFTLDFTQAMINLEWYTDGSAQGDYKLFVHVYGNTNQAPVAQWDGYPGGGTLPPGDWLPGVLRDTITVNLQGVAPGEYQVAIGLYNPYTNERLQPTGGDNQGRLFIGEIEVK